MVTSQRRDPIKALLPQWRVKSGLLLGLYCSKVMFIKYPFVTGYDLGRASSQLITELSQILFYIPTVTKPFCQNVRVLFKFRIKNIGLTDTGGQKVNHM